MAEVELSGLALDKATNLDIKSFAQRMIDDHGAAARNLKSVVSGQPIEWPVQLDDKHRKIADELAKKQGANFDRDYVKAMVEGHQDLAAKLESRLDVQSLADWKTAAAGRTDTKALPEPSNRNARRASPSQPERQRGHAQDQPVGGRHVSLAQKHLDTARTLETAANKRSTN